MVSFLEQIVFPFLFPAFFGTSTSPNAICLEGRNIGEKNRSSEVFTPIGVSVDSDGSIYVTDLHFARVQKFAPPVVTISIDIKPESVVNSINPKSNGKIPVAILTTDTFDVANVDPATVRFGKTGMEAAAAHYAYEDVNGDGRADLMMQFEAQKTGIVCGDTTAKLTGKTLYNRAIKGSDSIQTIGCK